MRLFQNMRYPDGPISVLTLMPLKFTCLYNLPGEGLVAAFDEDGETLLFDRQGLQYRIVTKKANEQDAAVEEQALAQMNSLRATQV